MQSENMPFAGTTVSDPEDLRTHDQIRASDVRGTAVFNTQGEHLGTVEDIVISKRSGISQYAIMSFGGFLGINAQFHPLPWKTLTYDVALGGYVIGMTRAELEAAPSFEASREPDWNDEEYKGSLGGFYGI